MKPKSVIVCLLALNILILNLGIILSVNAQSTDAQFEQVLALEASENAPVVDIAFSPNGEQLATLSGSPGNQIKIWNIAMGEVIHILPKPGEWGANHIQFSPDGKLLIANGQIDRSSQLVSWDVETGNLVQEGELINGDITSFTISPDGEMLIGGMSFLNQQEFTTTGAIYRWKIDTLNRDDTILFESEGDVQAVAFSSNGRYLTYVVNGSTPPMSLDQLLTPENMNSRNQTPIIGYLKLWDTQTNQTTVIGKHDAPIWALSISRDATLVATAGEDRCIKIWNLEIQEVQQLICDIDIYTLDFSPDGARLATSGSWDVAFQLWDVETGEMLMADDDPNVIWGQRKIVFSPNGQLLASGGEDGFVRVWSVNLN